MGEMPSIVKLEKLEDNISAEQSKARNFFGKLNIFLRKFKIIINCTLESPNLEVKWKLLVPSQFFQVSYSFY